MLQPAVGAGHGRQGDRLASIGIILHGVRSVGFLRIAPTKKRHRDGGTPSYPLLLSSYPHYHHSSPTGVALSVVHTTKENIFFPCTELRQHSLRSMCSPLNDTLILGLPVGSPIKQLPIARGRSTGRFSRACNQAVVALGGWSPLRMPPSPYARYTGLLRINPSEKRIGSTRRLCRSVPVSYGGLAAVPPRWGEGGSRLQIGMSICLGLFLPCLMCDAIDPGGREQTGG